MNIDNVKIGQLYLVEPLQEGEEEYIGKAIGFSNQNPDHGDEDDSIKFENGMEVVAEDVHEIN